MVRNIRWRREDPLEKRMGTHSSVIGVSLVAESIKNMPAMRETEVQPMEEGVATRSTILAWRIP